VSRTAAVELEDVRAQLLTVTAALARTSAESEQQKVLHNSVDARATAAVAALSEITRQSERRQALYSYCDALK
jgi:hypothetical protein